MVKNEANVRNARIGIYEGKAYTFTHRNPRTGEVYAEDYPVRHSSVNGRLHLNFGKWIPSESVKFAGGLE